MSIRENVEHTAMELHIFANSTEKSFAPDRSPNDYLEDACRLEAIETADLVKFRRVFARNHQLILWFLTKIMNFKGMTPTTTCRQ